MYYGIPIYQCPYGYSLVASSCYPIATMPGYKEVQKCPDGYTFNKSGIPLLEVPNLEVPGALRRCYRRIVTPTNY